MGSFAVSYRSGGPENPSLGHSFAKEMAYKRKIDQRFQTVGRCHQKSSVVAFHRRKRLVFKCAYSICSA